MIVIGLTSTWVCILLRCEEAAFTPSDGCCSSCVLRGIRGILMLCHSYGAVLRSLSLERRSGLVLGPVLSAQRSLLLMSICSLHCSAPSSPSLAGAISCLGTAGLGLVLDNCLTPLGGVSSMATCRFHNVFISVLGLPKNISVFTATSVPPGFSVFPKVYFPLVFLCFCISAR